MAAGGLDPTTALAMLNAQVQAQAAFIAYVDDFKLMMFVTLAVIPLLAFMRTPKAARRRRRRPRRWSSRQLASAGAAATCCTASTREAP